MKKNLLTVLFIFVCFSVFPTLKDTVKVYNPTFSSEIEKSVFDEFMNGKDVDVFTLALCVNTELNQKIIDDYRYSLKYFLDAIRVDISKSKKEKDIIKKIFKAAHQRFFKVYDLNSFTDKLYSDGTFNCVTGSLLFSHVLDSLKIPFQIKETETHVFLLAYPEKFSVLIETTDPNMTVLIPDYNFKRKYVDFLIENKLILKSDVQSKGVENIFNEKYYSKTNISPKELVGLLYYNAGTFYLNSNEYKKAFQEFEKAYILYPSERIQYAMEMSLLTFIADKKNFTLNDIEYLAKLSSYSENPLYDEAVTDEFKAYTYKYLVNENSESKYVQIYQDLYKNLTDSAVKDNISIIYYSERGRICMLKQRKNEGLKYIKEAYKINPVNVELATNLKKAFYYVCSQRENESDFFNYYQEELKEFEIYKEDEDVLNIGARYLLKKACDSYTINNLSMADKWLMQFEDFVAKYPNCKINEDFAGDFYAQMTAIYYRNGNVKQSNAILKRGMKIMPQNAVLIRKYKVNVTQEIK